MVVLVVFVKLLVFTLQFKNLYELLKSTLTTMITITTRKTSSTPHVLPCQRHIFRRRHPERKRISPDESGGSPYGERFDSKDVSLTLNMTLIIVMAETTTLNLQLSWF